MNNHLRYQIEQNHPQRTTSNTPTDSKKDLEWGTIKKKNVIARKKFDDEEKYFLKFETQRFN